MASAIYATVSGATKSGADISLGAQVTEAGDFVSVWYSGGGSLGFYDINRFRGAKLTKSSLIELFTPKAGSN